MTEEFKDYRIYIEDGTLNIESKNNLIASCMVLNRIETIQYAIYDSQKVNTLTLVMFSKEINTFNMEDKYDLIRAYNLIKYWLKE